VIRSPHSVLAATAALALATVPALSQPPSRNPVIATAGSMQVRVDSSTVRRARTAVTQPQSAVTAASRAASQSATPPQGAAPPPAPPQSAGSATISHERLHEVLGSSQRLRIVRASGVSDVSPTAAAVTVRPGEFLFRKLSDTAQRIRAAAGSAPTGNPQVRPDTTPGPLTPSLLPSALPATAAAFAMPYRWMTVDSAGVQRVLVPYFVLLGGGLSYDVESRLYKGRALIGVEDTLNQSAGPVTLARPLRMLLSTTKGGRISPEQIAIAHTSLDYDSVHIESPDSNLVHISTGADRTGIFIPIPVLSMTVSMTPQQPTIQGFGLGTTDIGVTLPRGMRRTDTAVVSFSAPGSFVSPNKVRVSGAEGATVRLRSGLPGRHAISAFIDGVEVGQTQVVSETPISFLVATLLGILLGGAARFVSAKRRKRVKALQWDIIKGAPFGVLAAIAGAVGLDLAQLKLGEPGALPAIMVTAAIGAWLGAKLLDRGGASAPSTA